MKLNSTSRLHGWPPRSADGEAIRLPAVIQISEDGKALTWSYDGLRKRGKAVRRNASPKMMLDRFIGIESAADVLAFAKRHGVLGICEAHSLPGSPHTPLPRLRLHPVEEVFCSPKALDKTGRRYSEPLRVWFELARQARSLWLIAEAVQGGKPGKAEDWRIVFEDASAGEITGLARRTKTSRHLLSLALTNWLAVGGVGLGFSWYADRPEVVANRGTFGEIAIQLATAIADRPAPLICTGCGKSYQPKRRPTRGHRNFCPECRGANIDSKYRQRDFQQGGNASDD